MRLGAKVSTMKRPRDARRGSGIAALALVSGFVLSLASSGSANAADVDVPLSWLDPATQTVTYGDYWTFTVATSGPSAIVPPNSPVDVTGATSPYHPSVQFFYDSTDGDDRAYLSPPMDRQPLEVGHYAFKVNSTADSGGDHYIFSTATAAQLTINKAPLGIDLRVVNDPNSTGNAIVSLSFTGSYIDNLYPANGDPSAPLVPSGIWALTVTGPDGAIAIQRNIQQAAGFASSTSFYWPNVPAGKSFKAKATFTADASIAGNFTISPSSEVDYTSTPAATPTPVPTELSTSAHSNPNQSGFALPLWLVIVLAVVILGLAVTVTILAVKNSSVPKATGAGRTP